MKTWTTIDKSDWMRNVKEGISTLDEAISAINGDIRHCREVYAECRRLAAADQNEQPPASAQAMTDDEWRNLLNDVLNRNVDVEYALSIIKEILSSNVQPSVNAEVRIEDLPPLPKFDYYVTLENGDDYGCWSREVVQQYALAAIRSLIDQPDKKETQKAALDELVRQSEELDLYDQPVRGK